MNNHMSRRKKTTKPEYACSGYRYAPESFSAKRRYPNGEWTPVPLTSEQRSELGSLYLCIGRSAARDFLVRMDRMQRRKPTRHLCYAFMEQGSDRQFLFSRDLHFQYGADLATRVYFYKALKHQLQRQDCKVLTVQTAELDAHYRPTSVENTYSIADLARPIIVEVNLLYDQT